MLMHSSKIGNDSLFSLFTFGVTTQWWRAGWKTKWRACGTELRSLRPVAFAPVTCFFGHRSVPAMLRLEVSTRHLPTEKCCARLYFCSHLLNFFFLKSERRGKTLTKYKVQYMRARSLSTGTGGGSAQCPVPQCAGLLPATPPRGLSGKAAPSFFLN